MTLLGEDCVELFAVELNTGRITFKLTRRVYEKCYVLHVAARSVEYNKFVPLCE